MDDRDKEIRRLKCNFNGSKVWLSFGIISALFSPFGIRWLHLAASWTKFYLFVEPQERYKKKHDVLA